MNTNGSVVTVHFPFIFSEHSEPSTSHSKTINTMAFFETHDNTLTGHSFLSSTHIPDFSHTLDKHSFTNLSLKVTTTILTKRVSSTRPLQILTTVNTAFNMLPLK